ncbi:Prespore-specific transcriptional regulator RsfA [compost metagenome]
MDRKDTWTSEDDGLLAITVLDCLRNGQTQLEAFKIVAEGLKRTEAACGFRWNSTVRKQYGDQIKEAKAIGRKNKPKVASVEIKKNEAITIGSVEEPAQPNSFDQLFDTVIEGMKEIKSRYNDLLKENEKLRDKLIQYNTNDLQDLLMLMRKAVDLDVVKNLINEEKPTG